MSSLMGARERGALQLLGAPDLADRPERQRQIVHERDADILTEAKYEIAIAGRSNMPGPVPDGPARSCNRPDTSWSCHARWAIAALPVPG